MKNAQWETMLPDMRMLRFLFVFVLLGAGARLAIGAESTPLTVFAASSLTEVMQKITLAYETESGNKVRLSFAASSVLARQIESGAPVDVFVSADQDWMDYLVQHNLMDPTSRRNIVGNSLVLIAPADSKLAKVNLVKGVNLLRLLGSKGRLATGDPQTVPAGRYARLALTSLGAWSSVASHIVPADNVRTALNFVARGEAPLGIVYFSDALADKRVRILATFPQDSHGRIEYPAAATSRSGPNARAFVTFLSGTNARKMFEQAGFKAIAQGPSLSTDR
jgi:molybdate transport system substrate-binding protein